MENILITPRERLLPRLLWISIALSIIILGLSMSLFGFMSYFVSPSTAGANLIFDITMLAVRSKERKLQARSGVQVDKPPNALPSSQEGHPVSPTTFPPPPTASSNVQHRVSLPCYCRLPSIFVAIIILLAWMADLPLLITLTVIFNGWTDDWGTPTPQQILPATILEIIFVAVNIGVWGIFCELCRRERRKLLNLEGKVKWYQLGRYSQA